MGGALPFIGPIFSLASSFMGGDEPEMQQAPAAPVIIQQSAAPVAPAAASTAQEVQSEAPVVDIEAARLRSDKRRRADSEATNALISLASTSPTDKAKTLLGE